MFRLASSDRNLSFALGIVVFCLVGRRILLYAVDSQSFLNYEKNKMKEDVLGADALVVVVGDANTFHPLVRLHCTNLVQVRERCRRLRRKTHAANTILQKRNFL